MTLQATVLEVSIMPTGAQVLSTLAVGTTVIPLGDVSSFDEAGGQVRIQDLVYSYNVVSPETDTITLATGLTTAVDEGDWAFLVPASEEKWALVQQAYDGEDMIRARVAHSLADRLPDGIREESNRESVIIEMQEGDWTLTDIIALSPSIDASYITGAEPDFTSDDLPPSLSPTPIAVGGVGSIFLTWPNAANHDPVTYEVYGSSTPGFTKNASTYLGDVQGTSMTVRTLNGGAPLLQETNYYFSVIAKDVDGSALPSAESNAAQLVKITNDMVAANYVYAGEIFVNQLRGGNMSADVVISGSFATALSGQRTVIDFNGQRFYGPDGTSVMIDLPNFGTPKFSGIINAFGITVNDGLELRGQNNVFAMSSVTTLQATTQGSATPPTLTVDHEMVDSQMTTYLYNLRGYHRQADGAAPTFAGTFYGYSRIAHNGLNYEWPAVTTPDGSNVSTRTFTTSTMVQTATGTRFIGYLQHNSTSSRQWRLTVLNPAAITANGVPPTELYSVAHGAPDYFMHYAMGRCFSPIGSSTLASHFALVEFDIRGDVEVMRFRRFAVTDTSIVQQGTDLTVSSPLPLDGGGTSVRGIIYGSSAKMGFPGTDQNIWVVATDHWAYVWNSGATARIPAFEFELSGGGVFVATGNVATNEFLRFESTPFYHDTQLLSTKYTNIEWTAADSPVWWVGYTWADSNTSGSGITAETNVSTLASVTMKRRARLSITVPSLPDPAAGYGQPRGVDDVNRFNVYMQRQATAPPRTSLWKQSVQPNNLDTSAIYTDNPVWTGTTNPPASTTFAAQAAARLQSSAVGADGLPKFLADGNGLLHAETLDVSGEGSTSLQGKAFEQLYYGIRSQARMSGGGQLSVSSTFEVKWSERWLFTAMGKSATLAPDGYFHAYMPPAGTVIQGYGGATSKTVTANGIPLADWDALWYEIPFGEAAATQVENYKITNYTGSFTVPNNWVMICVRNSDGYDKIDWAAGPKLGAGGEYYTPIEWITQSLANGWVAYGGGFQTLQMKRTAEGLIMLRGLIRSGTAAAVTTLITGCRPAYQKIFACWSNAGTARVDVTPAGLVSVISYGPSGSNAFVSFDNVSFEANG